MEILFDCVFKNTFNMRKRVINADGLEYWKKLKEIFELIKFLDAGTFNKIPQHIYDKYILLPEYENNIMIQKNHFLLQLVRIPINEKPLLLKILQLAYNAGQYYGYVYCNNLEFDETIIQLSSIQNFLSVEKLKTINNTIINKHINIFNYCDLITQLFSKDIILEPKI